MDIERAKVLVIDDDEVVLMHVERVLKDHPFDIAGYQSVQDFLKKSHSGDVDLILLDYYIPRSTALDNLAALREHHAPILLMSEQIGAPALDEAMQNGAVGYLSKDEISSDYLARRIKKTLELARSEGQERVQMISQLVALACHQLKLTSRVAEVMNSLSILAKKRSNFEFFSLIKWEVDEISSAMMAVEQNSEKQAQIFDSNLARLQKVLALIQAQAHG